GDVPGPPAIQPQGLLAMHVMLAAGRPSVLIDHFILRSPRQECDKVTRVFEFRRRGPHPPEEAPPDALQEVQRIEPGPQQPWQLTTHHQADLGLVPAQQLARRAIIARLDAPQEIGELAGGWLRWLAERHGPNSSLRLVGQAPAKCSTAYPELGRFGKTEWLVESYGHRAVNECIG